jgi:maltose alpha-D-glucosyltransferase/alpha-amylase
LQTPTDNPAFAAERIGAADLGGWVDAARDEANHGFALVERASANVPEADRHDLERLLGARQTVLERLEAIRELAPSGLKTRIHGDYHLGQVLATEDDVVILDFEGEPQRDVHERRQKSFAAARRGGNASFLRLRGVVGSRPVADAAWLG